MKEPTTGGGGFSQDVRSTVIRAGKRTYFFDVKRTRNGEMYIIITESKKRFENDGNFFFADPSLPENLSLLI